MMNKHPDTEKYPCTRKPKPIGRFLRHQFRLSVSTIVSATPALTDSEEAPVTVPMNQLYCSVVGEHALYSFKSQNLLKTCFIAQSTIHFGKKKFHVHLKRMNTLPFVQECLMGVSKVNFVICYFLFSHELFVCLLWHVFSY